MSPSKFLIAVVASVAMGFWSGSSMAQQTVKSARIGMLVNGGPGPLFDGIRQRLLNDLGRLGYVDGQSILIEPRFANDQLDRLPALAAELVGLNVDILIGLGGVASSAAAKATKTIPVIFLIVTDPIALGLVTTYERPGGNVTGITSLDPQQPNKQFALLKETVPNLERVAILSDPSLPGADQRGWAPGDRANDAAARALGLQPLILKVKGPDPDLEGAFAAMVRERAQALLVMETPVAQANGKRIAELAAAHRLPSLFPITIAGAGGVITFGTAVRDGYQLMPSLIDKILKGARPADLPVQVITRSQLIVNLSAARQSGVTIPPEVLKRADQVVQ